ncbi:MAG TPA: type III-A CRISPR-associated RAMP protein Csm5 [Accumulibacter sp.]|nr:type III-A CRISPR-associated RAMP protein Csm5 [Accumulibacter sp.]HMW16845.1 type III-A CRISPR-associated RAMP protein Csm5 [Accumulibacter sp.]HMX21573.1 type III-A CRISPR-associated RAMP protein Csm5 [Accumulibacter sp.]HND81478.1 type III-A CRISPR-associated RAMP protein Csm5 [Accumulibacter sp.]HNE12330.1 type III-A CRISPR-associated RAMP protein Csm5 [Accumulibacter sp.]
MSTRPTIRATPHVDSRPLYFSTLSPVHIGCGEHYEPSTFVIHDELLHVLEPATLLMALSDDENRKLAALASQRQPIAAVQRFFSASAARFSEFAVRQVAVTPALAREYLTKVGRPAQPATAASDEDAVYNRFQIARTAFRPLDGSPYLPGSSLKGSIRTAWLNQTLLRAPGAASTIDTARKGAAARLEQCLLGYQAGKFENDPFRRLALADAHVDDDEVPPPTQVIYAIGKKKRPPRPDERPPSEIKVFLETIPEALPTAFRGELRLLPGATMAWETLCEACNGFYRPRLAAELQHPVLGERLDPAWRQLIEDLIDGPLQVLIDDHQGFLLRVGHHSGAESVTLDEVRRIKILGPRINGKHTFDFRPTTTEQRLASLTRTGNGGLLPFGWLWVDASDDAHRHHADEVRRRLGARSRALRDAHQDRLLRWEEKQAQQAVRAAEIARKRAAAAAERAAAEAAAAQRQHQIEQMTPNQQRVQAFADHCAARLAQLRGSKENPHAQTHTRARELAREAADWPPADRLAVAEAIEHWLPQVVKVDLKEERKKLAALRRP